MDIIESQYLCNKDSTSQGDCLAAFLKNPGFDSFKLIPKRNQTTEIILKAIEFEPYKPILKLVSSRLLTRSICLQAVKKVGENLKYVPDHFIDRSICEIAVSIDGIALSLVPSDFIDMVMCRLAVSNNGHALEFVPKRLINKYLCCIAVKQDGLAVKHVPAELIDEEITYYAITNPFSGYWIKGPQGEKIHVERNAFPIRFIPSRFLTEKIIELSFSNKPDSLLAAPIEKISDDFCLKLVNENGCNLRYLPKEKKSRRVIDTALKSDPWALQYVPEENRTYRRCISAVSSNPSIPLEWFPDPVRCKYMSEVEGKPDFDVIVKTIPDVSKFPQAIKSDENYLTDCRSDMEALLDPEGLSNRFFYYISDLHLEHQLGLGGMHQKEVENAIRLAVIRMVASANVGSTRGGILLISGDISNGLPIEKLFYSYLCKIWNGTVVSVLGNHELWDFYNDPNEVRSVDEIVCDYRRAITRTELNMQKLICQSFLLENDLLLYYFDEQWVTLDETTILEVSPERLSELCRKSSIIILGGVGFSGYNPVNNAGLGYYGTSLLSVEDDKVRSNRFRALYEKVLRCARDLKVIVLTHTPMQDWSPEGYNQSWIYVNGHTHRNKLVREADGTTVFSDNQIGYHPKSLALKSFSISVCGRYNPFDTWGDGVYKVTREEYLDFNRGGGITIASFKAKGDVIMLKRKNNYMFFLQNEKLSILEGGRLRVANHDLQYYYDNLNVYCEQVRKAFEPYHKAIDSLSKEVQTLGGTGSMHGCIVDLDSYNHLYLNPLDGKITPYFALDMEQKVVYRELNDLLELSPIPPALRKAEALSEMGENTLETAAVPEIVLDKEIYKASRIMRCLQYVFDQQVIRVWNDEVLHYDQKSAATISSAQKAVRMLHSNSDE